MKRLNLFLIALLSLASLNARTLYLQPNENWKKDGARFAVYGFVDDSDHNWYSMTKVNEDIYSAEVDDKYVNVIFVRMNGANTENNWDEGNKWNQTADLTVPDDGKNLYTIADGAWDKGDGSWSVYDGQGGNNENNNGNGNGNGNNGNGGNNGGGDSDVDDGSLVGWFYKGYIDGSDVEPSAATKFVKGKASFACTQKSYLFVLYQDENGGVQYMMKKEDVKEGLTHASMYKGIDASGDKMVFEPGMYTLYLYDNGDDLKSVELSTVSIEGKKLIGAGADDQKEGEEENENDALDEVEYRLNSAEPMYNVIGMQVSEQYKGIVIQGGHKFLRQ